MSQQLSDASLDKVTGVLGMLLAMGYGYLAYTMEDSLLADAVGAGGVPLGVSVSLFAAAFILFLRAWWRTSHKSEIRQVLQDGEETLNGLHPHVKAGALLLILAVYVGLLPFLGYVLSIGLLVMAAAALGGARRWPVLLACAALSGPILWLIFDMALGIGLPTGFWLLMGK